jgi:hypothetical protein
MKRVGIGAREERNVQGGRAELGIGDLGRWQIGRTRSLLSEHVIEVERVCTCCWNLLLPGGRRRRKKKGTELVLDAATT